MESSRKQRWQQLQAVFEPGFKQMIMVSVLLHILIPALYFAPFFPKSEIKKPPVYRVNLVNKPVLNPQAGRPEAVANKKPKVAAKPKPKPKPKPSVKAVPIKPKPKPKPKPVPVKTKAQPKPKVKQPSPKAKPTVSKAQKSALEKRLEQLRSARDKKAQDSARKQRIAQLKAAALAESTKVTSPVDAPVGMIGGKGTEAGPEVTAFVQEYIRQQWNLSKYQMVGNSEAEVVLKYGAAGNLIHYKFVKKSGNETFDDSLRRTITKSKQLPQPLPKAMTFEIVFNLKDMLDR